MPTAPETPSLGLQDIRDLLTALKFAYKKEVYNGEALGNVIELYSKVRKFINTISPDSVEGLHD